MCRTLFLSLLWCLAAYPVLGSDSGLPATLPLGLDPDLFVVPEDNPITPAKIELGKLLYFDPRLSVDGTISCATCHDPQKAFTDHRPVARGVGDEEGRRNSPTVLNAAYHYFQFWDGRAGSLEEQAKGPIENPVEMAMPHDLAVQRLRSIEGYRPYFEAAFGDGAVDMDRVAKAIATFERTLLSGNSAWDRYVYGDEEDALDPAAQRGLALFEGKANCTRCHLGFHLTDGLFHNLGVGMDSEEPDLGRYEVTGQEQDKGAFKTPTLRDIQRTGPYMHDGSVKTLEEVVDLYVRGGEENPWLDVNMEPLDLDEQEIQDLLAFLRSLEGDWKPVEPPALPE
jgi:cytochrome c peroxidase